jgi:hypothetical protein
MRSASSERVKADVSSGCPSIDIMRSPTLNPITNDSARPCGLTLTTVNTLGIWESFTTVKPKGEMGGGDGGEWLASVDWGRDCDRKEEETLEVWGDWEKDESEGLGVGSTPVLTPEIAFTRFPVVDSGRSSE